MSTSIVYFADRANGLALPPEGLRGNARAKRHRSAIDPREIALAIRRSPSESSFSTSPIPTLAKSRVEFNERARNLSAPQPARSRFRVALPTPPKGKTNDNDALGLQGGAILSSIAPAFWDT